ncbi:MAG TPA: LytTR family DNA-binding domain-containing protein [Candidatus Limnocylindria bacterium]|jgi:two-component system LytT family response regulator|nr:LytTR family DNA-binding domain-containing protein [Candidatus Limnocylindria bacterium]
MKIRVLIVDDEPLARQRVRLLLEEEPDVESIGESGDGFEAVDQIQTTKPDLVFLDVQMPDMDGFEVLRRVPQAGLPVVIFTTANDQHALRAFEVNALDYLLKPFKPTRFKEAVQRARELITNKQAGVAARGLLALLGQTSAPAPASQLTRLAVKTPGKVIFVDLDQIHTIEAAGKYAVVQVGKENHILRETMGSLESHLPPQRFLRISRSVIVNIDQIQELQPMFKGESLVVLKNGKSYPTTRPLREIQQKLEFR